jgi:hypothetical protein
VNLSVKDYKYSDDQIVVHPPVALEALEQFVDLKQVIPEDLPFSVCQGKWRRLSKETTTQA